MKSNTLYIETKNYVLDRNDGEIVCQVCDVEMIHSGFTVHRYPEVQVYKCTQCDGLQNVVNG